MTYQMPTQTAETITTRYNDERMLDGNADYVARRDARLASDTVDYYRERRLKAIRRYLRERAAR